MGEDERGAALWRAEADGTTLSAAGAAEGAFLEEAEETEEVIDVLAAGRGGPVEAVEAVEDGRDRGPEDISKLLF